MLQRAKSNFPLTRFPVRGWPVDGAYGGELVITDVIDFFGAALWAWWDFSDTTTLFQDTAATTPATANNDPVGRVNDKSSNGRNLTQATAGARPLLKTSLYGAPAVVPDKIDDSLNYTAEPWGADKEVFVLFHVIRTSFPASATTVDLLMSSGIGGSGPYDLDTYNGFVNTTSNRLAQRRRTHHYLDGAPHTNGSSIGTSSGPRTASAVSDGTATSDTGWYIFKNSDGAQWANQPAHQIVVVDRAVRPWAAAETVAMHNLLISEH